MKAASLPLIALRPASRTSTWTVICLFCPILTSLSIRCHGICLSAHSHLYFHSTRNTTIMQACRCYSSVAFNPASRAEQHGRIRLVITTRALFVPYTALQVTVYRLNPPERTASVRFQCPTSLQRIDNGNVFISWHHSWPDTAVDGSAICCWISTYISVLAQCSHTPVRKSTLFCAFHPRRTDIGLEIWSISSFADSQQPCAQQRLLLHTTRSSSVGMEKPRRRRIATQRYNSRDASCLTCR